MKKTVFMLVFLFFLAMFLCPLVPLNSSNAISNSFSSVKGGVRMIQPVYVRLQAQQKGSVILWQAIPQDFSDHVGIIDVRDLAIMISSNARSINLSRDSMNQLWVAINYTFEAGEYISTLMWISSETLSENLTIPTFVSFPHNFPSDIVPFLNSGRKMPVKNETIERIANDSKTQNMVDTVRNVLNYVTENQQYNRSTAKLLVSGNLTTTSILDYFKGPSEVLDSNSSMCFERALLAEAILRSANVPTRTFTDAGLKTWIQVWLPEQGWVDAESLCVTPPPHPPPVFPRTLSSTIPWMVQNFSDVIFPFQWFPMVSMRVANLTFAYVEAFKVDEYRTILSEPIDQSVLDANPESFSFPVVLFESEILRAAVTREGVSLAFSLVKGKEKISKTLALNETNSISLGDTTVSFKPIQQGDFVFLQNFSVKEAWKLDIRILLIPAVGAPILIITWLYWRRKRMKRLVQKSSSSSL